MSEEMVCRKRRLSSFQIIILGFAGVILLGALLLILPAAGIMTMTEFTGILTGVLLLVFGINVIVDAYA